VRQLHERSCSFFVRTIPTTNIIAYTVKAGPEEMKQMKEQTMETGIYDLAFHYFCFWPTNASRITVEGTNAVAPFTGIINMVSCDSEYSPSDFIKLAESLESAVRSSWPGRAVEAFIYEGKK
jgi:hypothetical protein